MKLKGEDLSAGLVDWVKSEIKEAPKQAYDLGKFFFTVSIGTIGALAAIEKLKPVATLDLPMYGALAVLLASVLIAFTLALPRKSQVGGDTDLLAAYNKIVDQAIRRVVIWFVVWLIGTLIGAYAVGRPAPAAAPAVDIQNKPSISPSGLT